MNKATITIIGKTSKTGSRVIDRLKQLGYPTQGVSRSTSPSFDWQQPAGWHQALAGGQIAYVTYQPDLAVPQATQDIRQLLEVLKSLDYQHVVLLSGRGEPGAEQAEQILQQSGLSWNVVRASWFMQNFSEGFMKAAILQGTLSLPTSHIQEPFIDVDDIADVAVAALTGQAPSNRVFEVTGPQLLTFAECMQALSKAIDKPVQFQTISIEHFLAGLQQQGAPEDMLWLMNMLFTEVLDGRNSQVTQGVERVLGRPATDFTTYLNKTLAANTWQ